MTTDYEYRRNEEAKRRRAAALADYERRQSPLPANAGNQPAAVFSDTPAPAADTACSTSEGGSSCGGGG